MLQLWPNESRGILLQYLLVQYGCSSAQLSATCNTFVSYIDILNAPVVGVKLTAEHCSESLVLPLPEIYPYDEFILA